MLKGLNAIITGANKGIGKAISLELSKNGCNILAIGRTSQNNAESLYNLCEMIQDNGGFAASIPLDLAKINDETQILFNDIYKKYKSIDILINNAGFIKFGKTVNFSIEDFNYMYNINTRAPYILSKLCIPFMKQGKKAAIINISPPIKINPENFINKISYSVTKYLTSMLTLGLAAELQSSNIMVNSLWPKYAIFTESMEKNTGPKSKSLCRKPEIMAQACSSILKRCFDGTVQNETTGNFYVDEDVLKAFTGILDFTEYAFNPENSKNGKLIKVPYND